MWRDTGLERSNDPFAVPVVRIPDGGIVIIAVASGKGGTGKTTVAVCLAKVFGSPVQLLDCDVEEPNAHLFIGGTVRGQEIAGIPVPRIDASRCDACGECARFCQYHAIVCPGTKPLLFPELCHGCGGCARVCPRGAIGEVMRRIGIIEITEAGPITLIGGRLDVGVPLAPPLIRAVRAKLLPGDTAVIDAPPGTSCPVIAAVRGVDLAVLVTEPTPFGLHDLTLAVATVRELGIPFGIVINRAGIGDGRVHRYCQEEAIPILAEIPDDRRIAEAYSRGTAPVDALPEYRRRFELLLEAIRSSCMAERG
jgi:MinD superfamily P-loop ATPase